MNGEDLFFCESDENIKTKIKDFEVNLCNRCTHKFGEKLIDAGKYRPRKGLNNEK